MTDDTNVAAAEESAPLDFTTFLLSLGSSAMYHLGESPTREISPPEANLPLAKQTIDIIGLLEEKTKGNLRPEEQQVITTLLYDLRMRYLKVKQGK